MVVDAADDLLEAQLVGVALVTGRTVALRPVVLRQTDGALAAAVLQRAGGDARIVALARVEIASLVERTVSVVEAAL